MKDASDISQIVPSPTAPSAWSYKHASHGTSQNGNTTPKLRSAEPTSGKYNTAVSTDDSDDYQSAVDVSSPPSEDDEPDTPQVNAYKSSRRSTLTAIDTTPRESIDQARGR
jgi:hypothetical protein